MEEQVFYSKLLTSLGNQGFHIDPKSISKESIDEDADPLAQKVRLGLETLNSLTKIFDLEIEADISSYFKQEAFAEDLKKIYPITNTVFFKFILSQPVILSVVKADNLTPAEIKSISERYDEIMLNFRQYTAKMQGVKMSVTGMLLFVYTNAAKANEFISKHSSDNKIFHFWKKIWIVPWVIDTESKKVTKHSGLPFLVSIIDQKKLQADLFS